MVSGEWEARRKGGEEGRGNAQHHCIYARKRREKEIYHLQNLMGCTAEMHVIGPLGSSSSQAGQAASPSSPGRLASTPPYSTTSILVHAAAIRSYV